MKHVTLKDLHASQTKGHILQEWICSCGHEVWSRDQPEPIKWSNGQTCTFYLVPAPSATEQTAAREAESERDHS